VGIFSLAKGIVGAKEVKSNGVTSIGRDFCRGKEGNAL